MTPPGETLFYLNLRPLRTAGWLAQAPIPTAPGYAAFVTGSGFDFTRDLNALACSLHGPPLHPTGTTCVLGGHFSPRLTTWLSAHAQRRITLAPGLTAYQFPGWAQPNLPMYVYLPDASHLVATNAADPAAQARQPQRTPALWQAARGSALPSAPLGYLAINTLALAASRQLDGTTPPWRGAQSFVARLNVGTSGLQLTAVEHTASSADALAARAWMQQQIADLRPLLPPGTAGTFSARDLLDRLQLDQAGAEVKLSVSVPPSWLTP